MPLDNEQFNLNIFDHSTLAYSVVELVLNDNGQPIDWIYRYCNQAFANIKGFRLDAMLDHSVLSLLPKADEKWRRVYYQAAYEDTPCEMDLVIEEKNYHTAVMPVGKRGFCSCMIHSAVQTEDKQMEKERYALDKLSPEYVSLYRIELNSGKYEILRISENTNAKRLVGSTATPHMYADFDEFSRQYADSFILQEDREEFLDWLSCENMKKRLSKEEKITYHYHSVTKEGTHSFFEAYAVKGQVDDDKFSIFLGFRNIDSILYKEKAIQKKLQDTLDEVRLSNEIIYSIARTYQYISRIDIEADYFEEISNRDRTNLNFTTSGTLSVSNQKVCKSFVAEEYQDAFFKFTDISTLPERMKNEETIVLEYRMKDGNWHRLRFIEKNRDKNGRLTHVLCVIRSISDTKKREQDLLYQVEEAKKDAALKTRFLSNMSHDIRTPMNGIIGMVELGNQYPDNLEVQQKCRDKIMDSSKYLVSLMNDILDMNKLQSEESIDQDIAFNLADLLSRENKNKQILAADKNVDYIVDWSMSELKHMNLIGNPVYMERLLSAVTENAIKFTKPGGSVRVWCREKSADDEKVVYEFGCTDTGIGMSESFISQAFDMFSQENETSRSKYEGSGLGLAIAKKIVDRLGGTIELKSQKDIGTTAIVVIPFRAGEQDHKKQSVEHKQISVQGLRALIVEDNELNMEIAKFMLENNGINVDCAVDGLEAVNRFESSAPGYYNVIYMDIMMPNMNGWDATRKIRSMKRMDAENIPIIAMSANAFAEDIINSRISGMNLHLAKPLSEMKLVNALKECM